MFSCYGKATKAPNLTWTSTNMKLKLDENNIENAHSTTNHILPRE